MLCSQSTCGGENFDLQLPGNRSLALPSPVYGTKGAQPELATLEPGKGGLSGRVWC